MKRRITQSSGKRRTKHRKRSLVTTTYHEPKWMRNGRKATKTLKSTAWNVLGLIGLIMVALYLFNLVRGGG